jgi:hypothetical protein
MRQPSPCWSRRCATGADRRVPRQPPATARRAGHPLALHHLVSLFPIGTSNRAFLPVLWRDPEFERGVISERTRAGLKAARARGRKGGRPRKMTASRIRMALAAMADPKAGPKSISPASSASPPRRSTPTSMATARPRRQRRRSFTDPLVLSIRREPFRRGPHHGCRLFGGEFRHGTSVWLDPCETYSSVSKGCLQAIRNAGEGGSGPLRDAGFGPALSA